MTLIDRPGQPGQRTDVDAAFQGSATYRSLGEQQLSPAEERFEKGRRTVGLFLAPVVTIVFALLPLDLPRSQHLLAAVREHLDDRQVVELTVLVGGYSMVARFLVAMQVPPPDGEVPG